MSKLQKKRIPENWERGQSSTVVNMAGSQNTDQLVKASEVDNVRHAERDYFVKAWIACQYTGLYSHGVGLRQKQWDIIFRLALCFILGWEEGMSAQISGSQGTFPNSLRIEQLNKKDFFLHAATVWVLFDFMCLFNMRNISQAFSFTHYVTHCAEDADFRSK